MTREYAVRKFRAPVDLKINYAAELNPQQLEAVTAEPGPCLVIAGAGSGKTRTLTYRVAFLLEQGIPADRILLLTFTNKAAREMMRRAAELIGAENTGLWGGTFHSVGARVLRRHAEALGYRPDFTILDREDSVQLVKSCLGESKVDVKATRFPKPDVLAEIFSMAANTQSPLRQLVKAQYDFASRVTDQIEEIADAYTKRKLAANVVDFDDLLARWLQLLKIQPEIGEFYQRKFQFVLVDEYQDTNKLQSDLIDLLAARHQNLMVVGDDSQSIYAWRGAEYRNIIEFPQRYPKARVYKIEVNYRSTPEILAVANAAIAANTMQFHKELAPVRMSGPKPTLAACEDAHHQAAFVAQRVLELRDEGMAVEQMAVLYRSHFHAMELQLELTKRNIPFAITSGIRLFEQAHLKDVTAYLKLVYNPLDELCFKRIVLMLPGVGNKAAERLWQQYHTALPGTAVATSPPAPTPGETKADAGSGGTNPEPAGAPPQWSPAQAMHQCQAVVPKKAADGWKQLVETLRQLEDQETRNLPGKMLSIVVEAGYEDYLKENYPNYRNRLEDLEQLAAFSGQFPSLAEFLTQLSLLTNLEAESQQSQSRDDEKIRLSSIHQAKGLEWDVVFVIMLCENLFPSERSLLSRAGVEEERRLFYVALTRARKELYLSYPAMRFVQGGYMDAYLQPSRFLDELPRDLLDVWKLTAY